VNNPTADRPLRAVLHVTIETKPGGDYYFDHDDLLAHVIPWVEGALDDRDDIREVTITAQPPASPVGQAPATSQTDLRQLVAAAIWERQNPGRRWADCEYRWRADAEADADAVLAVLPAPTDRATVLDAAADALGRMDYDQDSNDYGYDTYRDAWNGGVMDGATVLRRMADDARRLAGEAATPEHDSARIVAYSNPHRPDVLLCRKHGDGWATTFGLTPVTSDDLPDGGWCSWGMPFQDEVCGADVLIPQEADRG
jgi:hypothetical protein